MGNRQLFIPFLLIRNYQFAITNYTNHIVSNKLDLV